MEIDTNTYVLNHNNYIKKVFEKTQIVIGNTGRKDMRHFDSWSYRWNGRYTKTTTFTINVDGMIYQHYDPKYYSDFIGVEQDRCNISVGLVNPGWLKLIESDKYVDWLGHVYTEDDGVYEKSWRGYKYWLKYSEKQIKSLNSLLPYLCDIYNIEENIIETNVYDENVDIFKGVVFRSNYSRVFTDVSPAFNIKKIKV